jgi:hypothetical protein
VRMMTTAPAPIEIGSTGIRLLGRPPDASGVFVSSEAAGFPESMGVVDWGKTIDVAAARVILVDNVEVIWGCSSNEAVVSPGGTVEMINVVRGPGEVFNLVTAGVLLGVEACSVGEFLTVGSASADAVVGVGALPSKGPRIGKPVESPGRRSPRRPAIMLDEG